MSIADKPVKRHEFTSHSLTQPGEHVLHLTHSRREDGAALESREPLSEEPSGRSHRDGLSAAPSPVFRGVTIEHAGKVFVVLMLGILSSIFGFLAWAVVTHGR